MSLQKIITACGLDTATWTSVSGGDINRAFCISAKGENYFLKINSATLYKNMFEKEARGLEELRRHFSLKVPEVIRTGAVDNDQYILMEWIDRTAPSANFWQEFGTALALLHKKEQDYFGFEEDNFIGSLEQPNARRKSWPDFYSSERILPLSEKLFHSGVFTKSDLTHAEKLCAKLPDLFPEETPSLLHGDLWSGNFMVSASGQACIYDPAVYYGHREMDLGMTKLFGGFDNEFYSAYEETYPLEKNWRERLLLTQLYPVLVHAVLFGGGYADSARRTMRMYI
jgi:fructosamine-3-kinase